MTKSHLSSVGDHSSNHCDTCGCPLVLTRGNMGRFLEVIAEPGNLERLKRILKAEALWEDAIADRPGGPRNV